MSSKPKARCTVIWMFSKSPQRAVYAFYRCKRQIKVPYHSLFVQTIAQFQKEISLYARFVMIIQEKQSCMYLIIRFCKLFSCKKLNHSICTLMIILFLEETSFRCHCYCCYCQIEEKDGLKVIFKDSFFFFQIAHPALFVLCADLYRRYVIANSVISHRLKFVMPVRSAVTAMFLTINSSLFQLRAQVQVVQVDMPSLLYPHTLYRCYDK